MSFSTHIGTGTRLVLTRAQARRFLLKHHHLWPPRKLEGETGILTYIRKTGCVQFDPLNMVGFNTSLVLQSRIRRYKPEMLERLLYSERALIEHYDKLMSVFPVEDWPCFIRTRERMKARIKGDNKALAELIPRVIDAIRTRGPLSSLDLKDDAAGSHKVDWFWAPANLSRAVMESLYFQGRLAVHGRVHTRRRYGLIEDYLPAELLTAGDPFTTEEEFTDWRVERRIGGLGLLWDRSGDAWLGIPGLVRGGRSRSIQRLLAAKALVRVEVDGLKYSCYLRNRDLPLLESVISGRSGASYAAILAPLDTLLWDRRFIEELFDFRYVWEVYKPEKLRQYGYYVLPVLYADRFIARFEPVFDRKTATLVIRNWWWEPGVKPSVTMRKALMRCFRDFFTYLDAKAWRIEKDARESFPVDILE